MPAWKREKCSKIHVWGCNWQAQLARKVSLCVIFFAMFAQAAMLPPPPRPSLWAYSARQQELKYPKLDTVWPPPLSPFSSWWGGRFIVHVTELTPFLHGKRGGGGSFRKIVAKCSLFVIFGNFFVFSRLNQKGKLSCCFYYRIGKLTCVLFWTLAYVYSLFLSRFLTKMSVYCCTQKL